MKRLNDWRRVLVGSLLLLNALPFSVGGTEYLPGGFFFSLAGCTVICWPILRELFFGPSNDNEAEFGPWDGVRVIFAALCFVLMVVTTYFGDGLAPVLLFAAGLAVIFIRVKLPTARLNAMDSALDSLDRLHSLELVTDAEAETMDVALAQRQQADRDELDRNAADLEAARSRPFYPRWLLYAIIAAASLSCVVLLACNKVNSVEPLPSPLPSAEAAAPLALASAPESGQAAPVAESAPATEAKAETEEPAESGEYVGSTESDKYHYPSCYAAEKILPENEIWFATENEAAASGYSPCAICKP